MDLNTLLVAVALIIAVGGIAIGLVLNASLRAEQARIAHLQNDLRALCNAAVNVGERINQLERRLRQISLRQDELGIQQGQGEDNRSFDQAAKLVRKGASLEEVMDVCGLSRGEVELIAMMQRLEKGLGARD